MNIYSLTLVAIALSLDAFGVAMCIGLNDSLKPNNKMMFALSFGFFQFLFAYAGAYAGLLFNEYIATVPNIIGGIVIAAVGIYMIKEGYEKKGECPLIKPGLFLILGISVSIDAMVIGFTVLNKLSNNIILFKDSLYIGLVTFIFSVLAFVISKYLRKIELLQEYSDYIGGIILIIFGLKMIIF